ncbi:MAG: hypothetical protein EAX91_10270 [Candidatus Lokiarchaeota archaeon]|nr:hypothetical protein [Candidatus Lokiarchaeota archaeon]
MVKQEEDIGRQSQPIIVYQFNDEIGDFEELIIDPDVELKDLLDDDFVLLFVDPQHFRVWLWHGYNTTTRMKFIAAKMAPPIRDKHGIAFKITAVDQDNESHAFLVMLGLEKEIDYDLKQTGPAYEGTAKDLELLEELSREKILLILEKAGIPAGYERKMVIVKNDIFGYREYDRNYLGSVIKEKQLFPLKEEIKDGNYLAENYVSRMILSYNKVVLTELLEKMEGSGGNGGEESDVREEKKNDKIVKESAKDLDALK